MCSDKISERNIDNGFERNIMQKDVNNGLVLTGNVVINAGDNRPIVKAAEKLQKSGIIEPRFLVVNFSIPLIAILFSNFKIKNTKKGNEN